MKKPQSVQWLTLMLIGGLLHLSAPLVQADNREIRPLKTWSGRVGRDAQGAAPARGYLINPADSPKTTFPSI